MKRVQFGCLFEALLDRQTATTVELSRPFDIDPAGGTTYSVARLDALVRRVSGWLVTAGVRPDDRVAVVKENHWDIVLLACAAARVGAVPVLISDTLAPDKVTTLLARATPNLIVSTARLFKAVPDAAALAPRILDLSGELPAALSPTDVEGGPEPPPRRRDDDAPLVVNHTSGTTGTPKLVVHSTRTIIRCLAAFEASRIPLLTARSGDVALNATSYVHGRAIPWTASMLWRAPDRLVIVHDGDPAICGPILHRTRPSIVETLPATYTRWQALVDQPTHGLDRVRLYVSTFDSMHPSTVRDLLNASKRRLPLWLQVWGQTETGPITMRLLTRRALTRLGARHPTTRNLGRAIPLRTRIRVVNPATLARVGKGEAGVLLARTSARCLGYLGEQHRWLDKAHGAWFNTGDIGSLSRSGTLRLLDREIDIIPGLSCTEIEDVIDDRLPEVRECVLLGTPGRLPLPVVVTADGVLDHAAWRAAVRDLPPMAEPVVLVWDQVPRTATGKVRRLELRDRLDGVGPTYGTGRWT